MTTTNTDTRKRLSGNYYATLCKFFVAVFFVLTVFPVSIFAAIPISNCQELQNMKNNLAGHYELVKDIDCSDTVNWNDGAGFEPVGQVHVNPFRGTFDGKGHIITGLYINRPSTPNVALFRECQYSTIRDVGLVDVDITGADGVAALAGSDHHNTYINCYSTGNVNGDSYVGGLLTNAFHSTVSNCYSTANVNGNTNNVGGLAANGCDGIFINCYSTGNVSGNINVGGLVGGASCEDGYIRNCYSTGNVNGNLNVGGLVGYIGPYNKVSNSYSTASVTGNSLVGGLVGRNSGTISNSYSTGSVTGNSDVGGLVGANAGTITNSYWDILTSGQIGSDGGEGKTTAQMLQKSTYVGWDFVSIWAIDEGVTYPYEIWQTENYPVPVPLNLTDLSQLIDTLPDDVLSDEIKNSLASKVNNALKSVDKEKDTAAINVLEALINQIEAQRGNKISDEAADMLIAYANALIAQIEAE
ncbi:MAG: hypothetical protein KAT11_01495 [Phycisphaerae bacterium]|nr:hypothetical protein [Phycisphaerae bacterium]